MNMINQNDKNLNLKNKLRRLEENLKVRQLEWDKRMEKLQSLRIDNVAKSRVSDQIELAREIQKEEASLRTLQEDLDNIESEIEITTQELEENSTFYEYRDTGVLPASALTYVKRKADTELFDSLMKGEFCYVFNSRQMGKSSLRVRIKADLEKKGFICVTILPTVIVASDLTEENWYKGIITIILEDTGLHRQFDINEWWEKQKGLSGVHKFDNFIRQVLLHKVSQKIIIFIDEIDRMWGLELTLDSFFAAMRECCNKRAENPDYQRLTFVLLGVATPSDLIRHGHSTPFNIGHAIDLTGFTFEEAKPLIKGLNKVADNPSEVLKEIIDWTMGQPYLTQMLCKRIEENKKSISAGDEKTWIESFIQKNIIENIQNQESPDVLAIHFKSINDRIRENLLRRDLLEIYKNIIENGSIEIDNSREQQALKLSGLVVRRSGRLEVYNRIYKEFFDRKWLDKSLTDVIDRPYDDRINFWLQSDFTDLSKLLYGDDLKTALKWSEGILLSREDNSYLFESKELDRKVNFLSDSSMQEAVIEVVMYWTNGQKELVENIFTLLAKEPKPKNMPAPWVEKVIRDRVIDKWETDAAAAPLRKIRDDLFSVSDPFWLLVLYRKVLLPEEINSDNSREELALIKSGIITKKGEQLVVANSIYENVFKLTWVNQKLGSLRPYAKKLILWADSNCQDNSHLLSKKELQIAREWIEFTNIKLNEREDNFIVYSIYNNPR